MVVSPERGLKEADCRGYVSVRAYHFFRPRGSEGRNFGQAASTLVGGSFCASERDSALRAHAVTESGMDARSQRGSSAAENFPRRGSVCLLPLTDPWR